LSTCLNCMVCIAVVTQFFYFQQYGKSVAMEGELQLRATGNADPAQPPKVGNSTKPLCASLERLDYWYNRAGSDRHDNHECIFMCSHGYHGRCWSQNEVIFSRGPEDVFFVTRVQDRSNHGDGVRNYLVPMRNHSKYELL